MQNLMESQIKFIKDELISQIEVNLKSSNAGGANDG